MPDAARRLYDSARGWWGFECVRETCVWPVGSTTESVVLLEWEPAERRDLDELEGQLDG